MAEAHDLNASTTSHRGDLEDEESLTPLEQEVLDEYARLLGNLNDVCSFPLPYRHVVDMCNTDGGCR